MDQGIATYAQELERSRDDFRQLSGFFNRLLEAMVSGLIVTNSHYEVEIANTFIARVLGVTKEELQGRRVDTLFNCEELRQLFLFPLDYLPPDEVIQFSVERDGRKRWFHLTYSTVEGEEGQSSGLICLLVDVTKQKEIERSAMQGQRLEAVGALAAGVAHEINTPMQFIRDNADFVRKEVTRLVKLAEMAIQKNLVSDIESIEYAISEIPAALEELLEGANSVIRIVKSMKEFSHPGSEGAQQVDINRCIESTVTVSKNEWKYVAKATLDLCPNLPTVLGQPGEINQVLLNVIVNAAHAIEGQNKRLGRDLGEIHIKSEVRASDVLISVTDNGGGIPEDIQSKVFDPFFTTKEVGRGTGQGLALSYTTIVEKHKGSLKFISEPGVGTTFLISLPKN